MFDLVFSFVSLSMDLPHQTTIYKAEDAIFLQNKVDHDMFLSQILHYLPFAYDPLHESPFKWIPYASQANSGIPWKVTVSCSPSPYESFLSVPCLDFLESSAPCLALPLLCCLDGPLSFRSTKLASLLAFPQTWFPGFQLASCTIVWLSFIRSSIHPFIHLKIGTSAIFSIEHRVVNDLPWLKLNCLPCSRG